MRRTVSGNQVLLFLGHGRSVNFGLEKKWIKLFLMIPVSSNVSSSNGLSIQIWFSLQLLEKVKITYLKYGEDISKEND